MNLRALAESDLRHTIEDASGAGTPYTLIAKGGAEYPVVGVFGDIGLLIDPITGEAIQGRVITATVAAKTILMAAGRTPGRGWKVRAADPNGKTRTFFVQRNEYDRTIGVCRLTLSLKLKEPEGE